MAPDEEQQKFVEDFAVEGEVFDSEDFAEGEDISARAKAPPAQSEEASNAAKAEEEAKKKLEGAVSPAVKSDDQADSEVDAEGKPKAPQQEVVKSAEELQKEKETSDAEAVKAAAQIEVPEGQAATPAQMQEQYVKWRGETEDLLAKHHYTFTQEQMDELDVNPADFISKAMSRVYLDAVTASLTQIAAHLPRMVQSINDQSTHANKHEEAFYQKWPQLKVHHDKVLRMGAAYRQMNPEATVEDFINEVGAQTLVSLRISPDSQANGNGQVQAQAAPAASKGFKPASSSASGGSVTPQKNVFAELADQFEEDVEDS